MTLGYMVAGSTFAREELSASDRCIWLKETIIALSPANPRRDVAYVFENMKAFQTARPAIGLRHAFDQLKRGVAEARKVEERSYGISDGKHHC